MKKLIYLIPLFFLLSSFISIFNPFKLPATWEKDFSIKLYQGGGMYYGSTTIIFDANGGVYNVMDHGKENIKKFTLSEKEKIEILMQLQLLKVDGIKAKPKNGITYDQATTSICFLTDVNATFCISTGATTEIEETYKTNFGDAWNYLQNFALNKTK